MAKSRTPARTLAAQRASIALGRATNWGRELPNLLIVGGQRCGTTSMYRTLTQHPAVHKAVLHKGVHYFDVNYRNGLPWYRAHFPTRVAIERARRRTGMPSVILESSPYYMFHPAAPDRIAAELAAVRVIALVRDPVERAYSAHSHESARGFESESFERALELETSRLDGEVRRMLADPSYESHAHRHNAYVTRGEYIDQLLRLEKALGRDRILVVDSQDFFEKPEPIYAQVLDFLGLAEQGTPVFEQHNARIRSQMPEPVHLRLDEHFRPYDERLAAWWGQTPSWRR